MRNLCTKCVVIHKMCKYVTFYTLSFLSPTPPMQYHLLPFSSSYFHLNLNSTIKFISQVLLIPQVWVYKRTIFSTTLLPILYQLSVQLISTRRTISSHYLHHSSLAIRHFFLLSVITFPLSKVASNSWIYAPRKLGMCKGGGLSPFPACPPSGVRGLTQ